MMACLVKQPMLYEAGHHHSGQTVFDLFDGIIYLEIKPKFVKALSSKYTKQRAWQPPPILAATKENLLDGEE